MKKWILTSLILILMKTKLKYVKRKDEKLFPCRTMPWRVESRIGMNLCWFYRIDQVEDYVKKFNLKPKDYRIMLNANVKLENLPNQLYDF